MAMAPYRMGVDVVVRAIGEYLLISLVCGWSKFLADLWDFWLKFEFNYT